MGLQQMIAEVLAREGGYVDHPLDKGGPTKYGITWKTLSAWQGRKVSVKDMQALTQEEASEIYTARYYYGAKVDRLPELLQPAMFDACVNHGTMSAWRLMQRAARAAEDGIPGEETFAVIRNFSAPELLRRFVAERRCFYQRIVEKNPSQRVFLKGWLNRLEDFA